MRSWLARAGRKASALFQVYLSLMVEYRAEIYLWVFAGMLPLILLGVWAQAGASGAFTLSRIDFIRYFIAAFVVRQFTFIWVIWEFEELVVTGKLSQQLLQPLNPVWRFLASHVTERVVRLPLVGVIVGLCFLIYPEAFWVPDASHALGALALIMFAFLVRFVMQYMMAMLAFWSERASAIEDLWYVLHLFLSGLIAPLEVYPPSVRAVAELTPFPYLIYYPAALLTGRSVPVAKAAIVLAVWGLAALVIQRKLWKKGIASYTAMGA
jgi:viologen exporter family transport system permease protein